MNTNQKLYRLFILNLKEIRDYDMVNLDYEIMWNHRI